MDTNKNISDDLKPLSIKYELDDQFIFNNNYFDTDLGYSFITNKLLTNVRDQKTNNFTNFYLTDLYGITDVGEITKIKNNTPNIVSYLKIKDSFISVSDKDLYTTELPFNKFEIVFLATNISNQENIQQCYLKTYISENNNYAYISSDEDLLNVSYEKDNALIFNYVINDRNQLFLSVRDSKFLTLSDDKLILSTISSNISALTDNQIINIENNIDLHDINYNTSWGVYGDNLHINKDKSYYNLANNFLVHSIYTEYNTQHELGVNLLTLKNQVSTKNYINNGDSFRDVNFREYTNLFTGTNQELGNNSITFNYNYLTTDIKIVPGINKFTTPDTIYPYNSLNINDSPFAKNGAFGSSHPAIADKIYRVNDNELLSCYTWLSSTSTDKVDVWMNRYFNPALFNYQQVSTQPANLVTNDTKMDELIFNNPELYNVGYFDVNSDLAIVPSATYVYNRTTNNDIKQFVDNNPFLAINNLTLYNDKEVMVYDNDIKNEVYHFDGNRYARVDFKTLIPYNQFCLSFYIDGGNWDNVIADQIMGNYNCNGFAIKKNTVITPTPMITFSKGIFFNTSNKWEEINTTNYGNSAKWQNFDILWNQYSQEETTLVRGVYLFNTNFEIVDLLPYSDALVRTVRLNHLDYCYHVYQTQLVKTTPTGVETVSIPLGLADDENIKAVSYDEHNIYCISDGDRLFEYNYETGNILSFAISSSVITNAGEEDINAVVKINGKYFFTNTKNKILDYNEKLGIFYYNKDKPDEKGVFHRAIMRFDPTDNSLEDQTYMHLSAASGDTNYTEFFTVTDSKDKDTIFNSIQDFKIIDDKICVLYKGTKVAIFNFNREMLYYYDFAKDKKNVKYIDYVSEITENGYEEYFIIVTYDKVYNKYNKEIFYDDASETDTDDFTYEDYLSIYKLKDNELTLIKDLNYSQSMIGDAGDYYLTNYSLIKKQNQNKGDFYIQYKLLNKYNDIYENRIINLPKFEPGKNHVAINFDGIGGKLEVYLNGNLKITDEFEAGKYIYENIFEDIFYVGTDSYFSVPIFKFLKQHNYFGKNFTIERFKIFNNVLDKDIIKALSLYTLQMDDLILNIPCGPRNKIETIERLFKEATPGFESNKINLDVKNMTISKSDQAKLNNIIRLALKDKLMLNVDIEDINYKFTF